MARPARRPGNLPPEMTSFIGRRRELAEARRLLTATRMVSLVGPGGVGKTRLAMRLAGDLVRAFPDGAWLVELADVEDPVLVANAMLAALGLRDQTGAEPVALLLGYLRERKLLLVLDNCEHVLPAAARLTADVLRAAPNVRVIATSREPLSIAGEHVIPVPPLDLPPAGAAVPLARLRQNESVMLFVERAAAASGAFRLASANQQAVVELCRCLDGLPLAIELAAVRTRVLTVEQILGRLADRFALLTGGAQTALPRHQTLRTTIDWSHDLLDAGERRLLRWLCVFAGRFTLDDVEAVCSGDELPVPRALDTLASLVDKSLVTKEDTQGTAGYRLHETMREYAGVKLREAGEEEAAHLHCAEYYRTACVQSALAARYRLPDWLAWMDLEIDNIRSVLRRCVARGDTRRGLDLASAVGWYWITRATSEGVRWLDELLPPGGGGEPAHALAYFVRGFLSVLQSEPASAIPALTRAASAARAEDQPRLLSESLSMASIAWHLAGDQARAKQTLDEAAEIAAGADEFPATVAVLQARALHGLFDGNLDAVLTAATEGARRSREAGDLYSLGMMLINQGAATLIAGDVDGAKPLFIEALRIAHRIDDRVAQYYLLYGLGCHAASTGQPHLAARLLGAADTLCAEAGARVMPHLTPPTERARRVATAELGGSGFAAEIEVGKRLSREAAIALALGEPVGPPQQAPEEAGTSPLRKREAEVALLVADGLTNKQIGARLHISEHTVDSHIRNILNKLGVNSRAHVAAWIAAARPATHDG